MGFVSLTRRTVSSGCPVNDCGYAALGESVFPAASRRGFAVWAVFTLAATICAATCAAVAGQSPAEEDISHFVPADKELPRGWVEGLYERGEKERFRGKALDCIGMPVGGIATGQLYLCGDGTLGCWEIFNHHEFRGTGSVSFARRLPEKPVDHGIAIVIESDGGRMVRRLERVGFTGVEFTGEYPIGTVRYEDPELPVQVILEAFSPFIPLNAKDSALPATIFNVTVRNTSSKAVRAACLSWLENAVCIRSAGEVAGLRRTRIVNEKGRALIVHSAEEAPKEEQEPERPTIVLQDFEGDDYGDWQTTGKAFGKNPARGTLLNQQEVSGFQGKGLVNTFLGGDEPRGALTSPPFTIQRRFINFLIGGGNHPDQTCINLVIDGDVVFSATGRNNERLAWASWNVEEYEGKDARIEIVDKNSGAWGHINVDQIEMADVRRSGPTGPIANLGDFGTLAWAMAEGNGDPDAARKLLTAIDGPRNRNVATQDEAYPFPDKRNAALLSNLDEIAPGAERAFTFVLAWHFPNFPNGHEYANRFADAPAVAHYVLDNYDRLTDNTRKWRDTYYDSTLPFWLLDRLHSTVSNMATGVCQWWENGRFWSFEGVVCCGGTCTHVWNYAHAHARLFPELARSTREFQDFNPRSDGGGFDPDTGLVGFRSNDAYAADGQCGTVLKAYREHVMSPNNDFLERNWPRVRQALEYSMKHDGNDDGLIENTQHNTYDINYHGANTFVGSLYLAALRAGEEMAKIVGDTAFAERTRNVYESGVRLSLERLWDGEYFKQEVDLEKFPQHQYGRGCLSDQLFGQGWAHQVCLGYIYPEEKVKQTLRSIWKYNWAPDITRHNEAHKPLRWFVDRGDAGLFTCTWPKSKHLDKGTVYKNEVWTGIEYQVAGNMIWDGMLEEALAVCRAVHDRYHPLMRNPYNEVECGDHYARALASWGVFLALCGYEYDGPNRRLGFAPRMNPEDFKAAFTAAEGWGAFTQKREGNTQRDRIEVRWGKLDLKTLAFVAPKEVSIKSVAVSLDGKPVDASYTLEEARLVLALSNDVVVNEGGALEVSISW